MPRPFSSKSKSKAEAEAESDSTTSSSENDSLSSSASSSSSFGSNNPWSAIGPITNPKTPRYLSRIQECIHSLALSLAIVFDDGDGKGWLEVRKWMKSLGILIGRWEWPPCSSSSSLLDDEDMRVSRCIGVATSYISTLFQTLEPNMTNKEYTSSLNSESFKSMIVVLKRQWPSLSTSLLFNSNLTPATAVAELIKVNPSVVVRFLALSLQRPGSKIGKWDVLDLSRLGAEGLMDLDFGRVVTAVFGLSRVQQESAQGEERYLVNLSHNNLNYVPKLFRTLYPQVYALDLSSNPIVGLPDYFRARAFDWHDQVTFRVGKSLRDFTLRRRFFPAVREAKEGRGVQSLAYYTIKRLHTTERDRQDAIQAATAYALPEPLLATLVSGYECGWCEHFFIESTEGYIAFAVVQLSPSGLAFGGRRCTACVALHAGVWPLFTG